MTWLAWLFVPLGIYLGVVILMFALQQRLVFMPAACGTSSVATPSSVDLIFEDLTITTEDHEQLHGWWVPANDNAPVILFMHGNAGNISHRLTTLKLLHKLGFSSLIFDYRGYGCSTGKPSEQGSYRDAQAAYRYLLDQRQIKAASIVMFGRSLGGGVASWLAAHEHGAGLILESTFSSVPDLGAELYPWLPIRWLTRIKFASIERIDAVDMPILFIHSQDDEVVPFHHSERLFTAAQNPKQLLRISGSHNQGFLEDSQKYTAALHEFVYRVTDTTKLAK